MTSDGTPLNVVPDEMCAVGRMAYGIAWQLQSGSASLNSDVHGLLGTWQGSAADAYRAGWDEMHNGATTVWRSLLALAEQLGVNAAAYRKQENTNVAALAVLRLD